MAQTVCVLLSTSDRNRLEAIASDRNQPRKYIERALVVLASVERRTVRRVATEVASTVERAVPAGRIIEAVVDNYATHEHPKVKAWLARHPRWTFHFTPTSGSWLNAVETFFSALTRQRIRRGSFHSIVGLQAAINCYLSERNAQPRPFTWTASAAPILAKLARLPVASE